MAADASGQVWRRSMSRYTELKGPGDDKGVPVRWTCSAGDERGQSPLSISIPMDIENETAGQAALFDLFPCKQLNALRLRQPCRTRIRLEEKSRLLPREKGERRKQPDHAAVRRPILSQRYLNHPALLVLEDQRTCQIAERLLLMGCNRCVANRDAMEGRQLEAVRDEAQDRGRVHRRVIDISVPRIG